MAKRTAVNRLDGPKPKAGKSGRQTPTYLPSEEEIAAVCREIRETTWSEQTFQSRARPEIRRQDVDLERLRIHAQPWALVVGVV